MKVKSLTVRIRAETVELLRGLACGMESWPSVIHRAAVALEALTLERSPVPKRRTHVRKSAGRGK